MRELISKGTRWIVGNRESIGVWTSCWIPRPFSFRPIQPNIQSDNNATVAQLIDKDNRVWREELVHEWFFPCNVDYILQIPLCDSWPNDKLIWHFDSRCEFAVRSAYHMARALRSLEGLSRSWGGRGAEQDLGDYFGAGSSP